MTDSIDLDAIADAVRGVVRASAESVLGHGHPSIDDVVNQTLTRLWERRFTLRLDNGPKGLRPFAQVVARNLAKDEKRKIAGQPALMPAVLADPNDGVGEWMGNTMGQANVGSDVANRMVLHQALNMLRPDRRELLVLRFQQGWTYPELAEQFGLEEATLAKRVAAAREVVANVLWDAREDLLGKAKPDGV